MRNAAPKPGLMRGDDKMQAVHRASDNIFADRGRPDAYWLRANAYLTRTIRHLTSKRGLTQASAAAVLGSAQPYVSNRHRGRLSGFSMERLYRLLNSLGQDVRIVVQPKPRTRARATVRTLVRATAG